MVVMRIVCLSFGEVVTMSKHERFGVKEPDQVLFGSKDTDRGRL
jgi:hypothetical protein